MASATVDWQAAGGILDNGGEIEGSIFVGGGVGSVVSIPVPGTRGLAIALRPLGYVPSSGSTSTLFIQDFTGKRHLRLDYGYNKAAGKINFHWNQKGTFQHFAIKDHTIVGHGARALHRGARYFKHGGRALMIVGLAVDGYEVVTSNRPFRQLAVVVAGWTGAWAGCKLVGATGAAAGTLVEPGGGTAVGGLVGCFIGGATGYWAGKKLLTESIDYADERIFHNVEEISAPSGQTSGDPDQASKTTPMTAQIPRLMGNSSGQPICSQSVGGCMLP